MSFIKSIATFGGFTMISRITGFIRDMIIANFLGAGAVSDAFLVSFKLLTNRITMGKEKSNIDCIYIALFFWWAI